MDLVYSALRAQPQAPGTNSRGRTQGLVLGTHDDLSRHFSRDRRNVHEERIRITGEQAVTPGQPVALRGSVELPPDGVPTFRGDNNNVRWFVIAHIDIPRWPDVAERRELTVHPS